MPKVSVIIPVYNKETYLADTLRSVLNQEFQDLEVIAVNDGSKDRSLEVLCGIAAQDSRLRIIDIPNGGVSHARNVGMEYAEGEWIQFLDADDRMDERYLAQAVAVAEAHQPDILFSDFIKENSNQEILETVAGPEEGSCGQQELCVRLRAAKLAGLKKVPVILREYSEAEMMEIALIENIQRHDLNPIEEAQGLQRLMTEFKLTQEQVAAKVGRSRAAVANILRLLNLADQVQEYIIQGLLNMGQAKQLVSLPQVEQQLEVAKAIIDNGWSSRTTEEVVRQLKAGKQVKVVREIVEALTEEQQEHGKKKKEKIVPDMYCQDFQNRLVQLLGTRVKVVPKAMDKEGHQGGTIEIEYYSAEDLERIYEVLNREERKSQLPSQEPRELHV